MIASNTQPRPQPRKAGGALAALALSRGPALAALALGGALALAGCAGHGGPRKHPVTPTIGTRIPVLSHVEAGAVVDDSIASVAVILPPATENDAWNQPGGVANKSYGNLALAAAPKKAWEAQIDGSNGRRRLAATPVIGDGRVYVEDALGVVHAFDAGNGKSIWTRAFEQQGEQEASVFGGGVSLDAGRAYVTTGYGDVAALDATNGKQLWRVKPAGPLRGSPTVAFGSVFVATQNNEIHALSSADGTQAWMEAASPGEAGVFGVAAPAAGQGTVIAGFSTGELVAYRYENGRQLWSDALSRTSLSTSVGVLTDIDADPIIDHGRVYALGQGGRMAAYELVSGQRIWELNLAGISTPALAGDWIFALTDDARVLCIARSSGKVRWIAQLDKYQNAKKKTNPIYWTGPTLAGDRLWVASSRGDVVAIDASEGRVKPFAREKEPISLAPVVAKSTLYVMTDLGRIIAYR